MEAFMLLQPPASWGGWMAGSNVDVRDSLRAALLDHGRPSTSLSRPDSKIDPSERMDQHTPLTSEGSVQWLAKTMEVNNNNMEVNNNNIAKLLLLHSDGRAPSSVSGSGSSKSGHSSTRLKESGVDYYDVAWKPSRLKPGKMGDIMCMATGDYNRSNVTSSAHIPPKSWFSRSLANHTDLGLFGPTDARGTLLLSKEFELLLDTYKVALKCSKKDAKGRDKYKIVVMDNTARGEKVGNVTLHELDGKELFFNNSNRPVKLGLNYHYVFTKAYLASAAARAGAAGSGSVEDDTESIWSCASGRKHVEDWMQAWEEADYDLRTVDKQQSKRTTPEPSSGPASGPMDGDMGVYGCTTPAGSAIHQVGPSSGVSQNSLTVPDLLANSEESV